jgi:uncharacterized membrane protein YfcA
VTVIAFASFVAAGMGVGVAYGCFGAGGSAFATPVLALLGLPGVIAVATPLPALLPASLAGAASYRRSRDLDWTTARRTLTGAIPMALLGAALSKHVGGRSLLVLSASTLAVVGVGLVWPRPTGTSAATEAPESHRAAVPGWVVTVGGAGVGFLTGLLANGGGFLLVPFFAMALGMSMRKAAGTSLVTAAALAVPTTLAHGLAGNIDWTAAAAFALGLAPAAVVGSRLSTRLTGSTARNVFGLVLIAFAAAFTLRMAT